MAEPLPAFVARRRPDWDHLRALITRLKRKELDLAGLEQLDGLYRRATSDLAYAQARYPNTEAHRFLNQLCAEGYAAIYQPPRERTKSVIAFYRREFPRTLRRESRFLFASLGIFLLATLLGALVVAFDPHGAEYLVPQTLRDYVAHHRMWTDDVLSIAPPGVVASKIATNNLTVMIFTFASGLLLGLGTVYSLVTNGLMVGSIIALCAREHMGLSLFSFIGGHGPVELSTIVISGAAGLILAQALLAPGELTRAEALVTRAREAVKLVLGCAPFLGTIALVEGFVSPGAKFAAPLKLSLGLALGVLFWSYLSLAGRGEAYGRGLRDTVPREGSSARAAGAD